MENISISSENQQKSILETEFENLSISSLSESYLMTTAKWAKFLAILGFIMVGLMLVVGGGFAIISGTLNDYQSTSIFTTSKGSSYMGILYLIVAAFYFFPTYYLLLFANKTKQAILDKNPVMLEDGFRNMKRYAKFVGIMMIVIIAIYVVIIFAAIIIGVTKASGGI